MRCKYIYKNGFINGKQCEREAEPGSEYCFWHEPKDGKDLSSKKIKEKSLQETYLVKANLANTEFEEHTDLSFADFKEAELWGTNLKGANLTGANLQGARLWQANLQGATLTGANFEETYSVYRTRHRTLLSLADLQGQELYTANFQGVYSLGGTIFKKSILPRANFRASNLKGTDFSECDLEDADFTGSYLARANLKEANLGGTNLEGAFLYGLSLNGIKKLQYAHFSLAIEEIIGDITLKLGMLKDEEVDIYWQKFSDEIVNSLRLNKVTKEDSKMIVDSIINYNSFTPIDDLSLVLQKAGVFYEKAKDVYLNFKNYFRDSGLYELSGRFYVLEQMTNGKIQKVSFRLSFYWIIIHLKFLFSKRFRSKVRESKMPVEEDGRKAMKYDLRTYPYLEHITTVSLIRDIRNFFGNLLSWIGNIILEATSLYGESPLMVILTVIEVILLYALIYAAFGGVVISSNSHIAKSILDYIYFSIGIFLTMSYGDLIPTPSMRLVAESEAFCGAFLLAYFVVVVSRKIMR
jgi:uncharacterized protein YjbI with pentapeptide repeats